MSPENSTENPERQIELVQFLFPNDYPPQLVKDEIEKVAGNRFIDPQFDFDPASNIGTIWHVQISFISEKPRREIEEMTLEELELELLVKSRLPDKF